MESQNSEDKHEDAISEFSRTDFEIQGHLESILSSKQFGGSSTTTFDKEMRKIEKCAAKIGAELHQQVASGHVELLSRVVELDKLESDLQSLSQSITKLQNAAKSLHGSLADSYLSMKTRITQLENIWNTAEMLRAVLRFLYLSQKLKTNVGGSGMPAAAAPVVSGGGDTWMKESKTLYELETLLAEADLSGIDIVDSERPWILQMGKDTRKRAAELLKQGISTLNQADVGTSLQAFHNLGALAATVSGTVDNISNEACTQIRLAFDFKTLNRDADDGRESSRLAQLLFGRLEKLTRDLTDALGKVSLIARVLSKKRDVSTQILFAQVVIQPGQPGLVESFWKGTSSLISEILLGISRSSPSLHGLLVENYPRVLAILQDYCKRTEDVIAECQSPESTAEWIRTSTQSLENEFLGRSLRRLLEKVNSLFTPMSGTSPSGTSPTSNPNNPNPNPGQNSGQQQPGMFPRIPPAEVRSLCAAIALEVSACVKTDARLTLAATKGVAKALHLFAAKCEQMIMTDADSIQLRDSATDSQLCNANVYNTLHLTISTLQSTLMQSLPFADSQEILKQSLGNLERLGDQILEPLFATLTQVLQKFLLRLHKEDFANASLLGSHLSSGGGSTDSTTTSPYLSNLERKVNKVRAEVLTHFDRTTPAFEGRCKELAAGLVRYFVRHAALIRPLTESGKVKLAGDIAQIQVVLSGIFPVEHLGPAYKELRSLRTLIFTTCSQMGNLEEVAAVNISPITVLHLLFSRLPSGPSDLVLFPSPHQIKSITFDQYSDLLDAGDDDLLFGEYVRPAMTLARANLARWIQDHQPRSGTAPSPDTPELVVQTLENLSRKFFERGQD